MFFSPFRHIVSLIRPCSSINLLSLWNTFSGNPLCPWFVTRVKQSTVKYESQRQKNSKIKATFHNSIEKFNMNELILQAITNKPPEAAILNWILHQIIDHSIFPRHWWQVIVREQCENPNITSKHTKNVSMIGAWLLVADHVVPLFGPSCYSHDRKKSTRDLRCPLHPPPAGGVSPLTSHFSFFLAVGENKSDTVFLKRPSQMCHHCLRASEPGTDRPVREWK